MSEAIALSRQLETILLSVSESLTGICARLDHIAEVLDNLNTNTRKEDTHEGQ